MELCLACSMLLNGLHRVWICQDLQSLDNGIHPLSRHDECHRLIMTGDADGILFSFLENPRKVGLRSRDTVRIFHWKMIIPASTEALTGSSMRCRRIRTEDAVVLRSGGFDCLEWEAAHEVRRHSRFVCASREGSSSHLHHCWFRPIHKG
jgi:hypothetical protein